MRTHTHFALHSKDEDKDNITSGQDPLFPAHRAPTTGIVLLETRKDQVAFCIDCTITLAAPSVQADPPISNFISSIIEPAPAYDAKRHKTGEMRKSPVISSHDPAPWMQFSEGERQGGGGGEGKGKGFSRGR